MKLVQKLIIKCWKNQGILNTGCEYWFSDFKHTVNETSDVVIDLSGKLIEICVKTLIACNIARVGNFIKAILKC